MQRTLTVLANEYAVTDSTALNPRAISLGVSPCIGVALMLNDKFNTAAVGHFFAGAQTLDDPPAALKAYVDEGFKKMLEAMHWEPGMKIRAGIVGGKPGWGEHGQSELLSQFVHAAIAAIPDAEIVLDRSFPDRPEDIVADCTTGDIHPLGDKEISQMLFDSRDKPRWWYPGLTDYIREDALAEAKYASPTGSHFLCHPQSLPR